MWETYKNVVEHDMGLLKEYSERNPAIEKDGRFGIKGKKKLIRKKNKD
jgi:hypothetical protein